MDCLFNTTADEVAQEFHKEALNDARRVYEWAGVMIEALSKHNEGVFSRHWITVLNERVDALTCHIDLGNGAVLVRGKLSKVNE